MADAECCMFKEYYHQAIIQISFYFTDVIIANTSIVLFNTFVIPISEDLLLYQLIVICINAIDPGSKGDKKGLKQNKENVEQRQRDKWIS